MVDETPQINPVDPGPVPDPIEPWQSNGVSGEPMLGSVAAIDLVAEPDDATATDGESVVEAEAPAPAVADAAAVEAEAPAPAGADAAAVATDPAPGIDDSTVFLASLAQAMREAAHADRTRVADDVDRRRDAHVAGINARRDEEAARMRELAVDDRRAIDAWVEAEEARIAEERDRRNAAVDSDLETSLTEHGAMVDREIVRVEAAIAVYRQDVDAYFARLEGDSDPVLIAQHAARRPVFPDLDKLAQPPDETAVDVAQATVVADQSAGAVEAVADATETTAVAEAAVADVAATTEPEAEAEADITATATPEAEPEDNGKAEDVLAATLMVGVMDGDKSPDEARPGVGRLERIDEDRGPGGRGSQGRRAAAGAVRPDAAGDRRPGDADRRRSGHSERRRDGGVVEWRRRGRVDRGRRDGIGARRGRGRHVEAAG